MENIIGWGLKRRSYGDRVIMIAWSRFNSHPYRHVAASLDKARWLCLVASNKQHNSVVRSQRNNRKTRKWTTAKRVRIRPKYSATVAFSWQEDKDETKQTNKQIRNSKSDFFICFVCLFVPSLSSCQKKVAMALHFGWICICTPA